MKSIFLLSFILISIYCSAQTMTTLAGSGNQGYLDGPASEAQFFGPEQTAYDSKGNLYVCDALNNVIRKLDTNGDVSTFAGTGVIGDVIGPKETAQFDNPLGIAIDKDDNIYIVDNFNDKVKVIRPNGMVELVAGSGEYGSSDGPSAEATFSDPVFICIDGFNNLYVGGNNDERIRKIDLMTDSVSTFAGSGDELLIDGVGEEASFWDPQGVAVDKDNNLYVGDRSNNAIRKITPDRVVTTYAGAPFPGYNDGPAETALFNGPKGVAVDADGNVYVADRLNFVIRKIDTSGMVSTVAGTPEMSGLLNGAFEDGNLIGRPVDVLWTSDNKLIVADWLNEIIREVDLNMVSTIQKDNGLVNKTIEVFPNPASDFVNIKGDLGKDFLVGLFNSSGALVKQYDNQRNLDLSEFESGVYWLKVFNDNYENYIKIVIQ